MTTTKGLLLVAAAFVVGYIAGLRTWGRFMGWSHDKWERYVAQRTGGGRQHQHRFQPLTETHDATVKGGGHTHIIVMACPDCRQLEFMPRSNFDSTTDDFKATLKKYLVKMGYGLHVDAAIEGRPASDSVAVGQ